MIITRDELFRGSSAMYLILKLSWYYVPMSYLVWLYLLQMKYSTYIATIHCSIDYCDEFDKLTNFQLNIGDLDLIELWSKVEGGGFDDMMRVAQLSKVNIIKFNPR